MDYKFCPLCTTRLTRDTVQAEGHPACLACGFIQWNNPVPCVAVLCPVVKLNPKQEGIVAIEPNAVVLVQRGINPGKGKWCLPCGYVNAWEDPRDAAKRETLEETGLIVELMQLLYATKARDQNLNNMILFYMARVVGGEDKAGDDALASGWFKRDELPELAFETHKETIHDFFDGRWPYTGNMTAKIRLN